jgi:hypothetical protein
MLHICCPQSLDYYQVVSTRQEDLCSAGSMATSFVQPPAPTDSICVPTDMPPRDISPLQLSTFCQLPSIILTGYVHHQLQCTQQLQDYYQLFDCSTPICYCFDLSRICYYFVQSDRISFCYPMPHSSNAPSVFARPSDLLPSLCSSVSTRQEDLSSTGSMATSFVSP